MKGIPQYADLFRVLMGTLAVLVLVGILTTPVAAGKVAVNPENELMVSVLTIDDKAADFNYIFIGERRFRVSTSAKITSHGDRRIRLKDLRTPCRAEITYQLFGDNRDPMVYRIDLK